MGLRIQNNLEAFNAHRSLSATSAKQSKAMEKLSSGFRINRSADDAAGLAISEKMRGQIAGLAQAQRNAQDGVSMIQTAEGALNEVHSMLQRVRELKVQASNGTLTAEDKDAIVSEVSQLAKEVTEIGDKTTFNGIYLLKGDVDGPAAGTSADIVFQVGANAADTISYTTKELAVQTGVSDVVAVGTAATAAAAATAFDALSLDEVDSAIKSTSALRSDIGAVQNRLEHRLTNLATYQENLVASESRIRDVDMAQEMVNFTKLGVLQQAGTAMLAQANQSPQSVLSLLR